MKRKHKKDLFFILTTVFCIFVVIFLLAAYSANVDDHGFSFASGFIFGTLISQFLFLFFNKDTNKLISIKKTKRGKDIRYWWNDGEPPNFKDY